MRVTSFCPGHITGFFQIVEHEDPLRSGSRGAGMCVALGAKCDLEATPGNGKIEVRLDGRKRPAPVTIDAIAGLPGHERMDCVISIENELPTGQGFGMSAAGALAAGLAASATLGLGRDDAIKAAHRAEIKNRTGLGDVAALSIGGITSRQKEGIPPHGLVNRIDGDPEVVLCVIGRPISTAKAISDPEIKETVHAIGSECVKRMAGSPSLLSLMRLSREFMTRTGLADPKVEEAVEAVERAGGKASMVMLGTSVFALGDIDGLYDILRRFGHAYRTRVDLLGPRIISIES